MSLWIACNREHGGFNEIREGCTCWNLDRERTKRPADRHHDTKGNQQDVSAVKIFLWFWLVLCTFYELPFLISAKSLKRLKMSSKTYDYGLSSNFVLIMLSYDKTIIYFILHCLKKKHQFPSKPWKDPFTIYSTYMDSICKWTMNTILPWVPDRLP